MVRPSQPASDGSRNRDPEYVSRVGTRLRGPVAGEIERPLVAQFWPDSAERGALAQRVERRNGSVPSAYYTLIDKRFKTVQVFRSQRHVLCRPVFLQAFNSPCPWYRGEGDIARQKPCQCDLSCCGFHLFCDFSYTIGQPTVPGD